MPQWAGSCWYYLRYLDPHNGKEFASREKIDYWAPVDLYVGGTEHAVLHLLYSRFWHKVFYDLGLVNTKEPFQRLVNQGMILGEDNQKMSKSRGNVVNPDDMIKSFGADAVRVYEMFMGPLEVSKPWNTAGLVGVSRFLERLWSIGEKIGSTTYSVHSTKDSVQGTGNDVQSTKGDVQSTDDVNIVRLLHKTIKKVTNDTATLNFNTAISQMMIYSAELASVLASGLTSELAKLDSPPKKLWEPLIIMAAAYAPHLGEELWEMLGHTESVSKAAWPKWDEALAADKEATIVVQVSGKVRGKFTAAAGTDPAALEKTALASEAAQKWLEGKEITRVIVVPDKLVNFVVKQV
jgi:leucyl-tRNA synthetase